MMLATDAREMLEWSFDASRMLEKLASIEILASCSPAACE